VIFNRLRAVVVTCTQRLAKWTIRASLLNIAANAASGNTITMTQKNTHCPLPVFTVIKTLCLLFTFQRWYIVAILGALLTSFWLCAVIHQMCSFDYVDLVLYARLISSKFVCIIHPACSYPHQCRLCVTLSNQHCRYLRPTRQQWDKKFIT